MLFKNSETSTFIKKTTPKKIMENIKKDNFNYSLKVIPIANKKVLNYVTRNLFLLYA